MNRAPQDLIRPDRYQVFLMASPASIPLNFACHPWFVVNKKGAVARWGVGWRPEQYGNGEARWGHIATNILPPFTGLRVWYSSSRWHWRGSLLKMIEGGEGSVAARMIACIEHSPEVYPYRDTYSFFGPNSNTYVEWILNQYPEAQMRLPWNAFGKHWAP